MTRSLPLAALLTCLAVPALEAQGRAGAAIEGLVTDTAGAPVAGAVVTIRHMDRGIEYRTVVNARGRFLIDALPAGGPYRLEARMVGRAPARLEGIRVSLGERLVRHLVLQAGPAVALDDLAVTAPLPIDGGPGYAIPGPGIRELPLSNRNFIGLFATVPQAVGRDPYSIGGQHPGSNLLQVDGGAASDLYGVSRTPGGEAGAKAISLEALVAIRVLVAPFDVRQGGFSGGLINAVTRSGTNQHTGYAFTSLQRPFLVGADTAGREADDFERIQYGFALGGPIRRDRLHYFVVLDAQQSSTPFTGPEAGAPGTGISDSTARRAALAFRTVYGFDAGGPAPPVLTQPDRNVFAKLSWQPRDNQQVELTHSRVDARNGLFNRQARDRINRDGWALSRSGGTQRAAVRTTRVRVTRSGPRWAHELTAGYQTTDEDRESTLSVPLFLVEADARGTYLAGGSIVNGQGTVLDQRLLELASHATRTGERHQLTAGLHAQLLHFRDNLVIGGWGVWRFPSVEALEQRAADRYETTFTAAGGNGPVADFGARHLAVYVQDRWTVSDRLTLTAGVRGEAVFTDAPPTNPILASSAALGRLDTGDFPSGNLQVAPRLGLVYALDPDHRTVLRAGIGSFTGRVPFAWLGGAFSATGLDQHTLICTPLDGVPAPVTDPSERPTRCLLGTERPTPPATVVTVAPGFRLPQATKVLLGLDQALGHGVAASLDLIHTRTRFAPYLAEVNLNPGDANAEGRTMYGTVTAIGTAIPDRPEPLAFRQVFRWNHTSGDRSTALTLSLQKTWRRGGYVQAGYQWSRTEDRYSVNRMSAPLAFLATPIDGTIAERRRTRSTWDVPHVLTASASVPLAAGFRVAFLARHQSGRPYAWAATGDANADGVASNDLLYVPRDAGDISLDTPGHYETLDRFIRGESCLDRQRGRIMARNSCRNPAFTLVDARVAWSARVAGRPVELSADFFNLPNLMNRRWGLLRETSANEAKTGLVTVSGWDQARSRPVYSLPTVGGAVALPARQQVLTAPSRWRIQLGARVGS